MVETQNSQLTQEIVEAGLLQSSAGIPRTLSNTIQPTIEVNPKLLRKVNFIKNITRTTSTTGATIFTTNSSKETFITGIAWAWDTDAAHDGTLLEVTHAAEYGTVRLLSVGKIALTAQSRAGSINFSCPVPLKKNTVVTIISSFTAGVQSANIILYGYEV